MYERESGHTAMMKDLREGSSAKRGLILDAAQELFLTDGFARTKMDDIAARSGVTKRTAYDYYGDKQGLFAAVLERVIGRLDVSIRRAIDNNLVAVDDLETSLLGFAREITRSALGSSDYATLARLIAIASADVPTTQVPWEAAEPEEVLAARFAELHLRGLLQAPNPRRAADHFVALTLSLSGSGLRRGATLTTEQTDEMISDGVRAFLRAYGQPQPH
jgi:TetR/AcrR family transcriptional repressor of mexJK operon